MTHQQITVREDFRVGGQQYKVGDTIEVPLRVARIAIFNKWAVAGEHLLEERPTLTLRVKLTDKCIVELGEQELVEHLGLELYEQLHALGKAAAEVIATRAVVANKSIEEVAAIFALPPEVLKEATELGDAES